MRVAALVRRTRMYSSALGCTHPRSDVLIRAVRMYSSALFRRLVTVAGICPARQQTLRPTSLFYHVSAALSSPESVGDYPYLTAKIEDAVASSDAKHS